MYYIPSQYLKAESELTKLVSEVTHTRFYTEWMISQPLTKRDKVVQIQNEFPWKCLKCNFFTLAFWPWYHSGTERLRYTKDYFYFYPQIFPCLLAIHLNWKWGDGTSAHLVRVSLTVMLITRAVLLLRCITLTCFYATEVWFTCGLQRKKIYLAHTLEWHTWFWQHTF